MKIVAIFAALVVVLFGAAIIVPNMTDPSFGISVERQPNGNYFFTLAPIRFSNGVYNAIAIGPNGTLTQHAVRKNGVSYLTVSDDLPSGTTITIECDVQYDRWISAYTKKLTKTIIVP